MARIARVVLPGYPHHVIQRGNRRQRVFFHNDDYAHYLELIATGCRDSQTECLAYCLMPNHVHLVLTPNTENGLRSALAEAHRHYTRRINFRNGWRGHLWQERFQSFPMKEAHLAAAVRYVELNPVRARLVSQAKDWKWSSAHAHLKGADDMLVRVEAMLR
jgi:putative transposase